MKFPGNLDLTYLGFEFSQNAGWIKIVHPGILIDGGLLRAIVHENGFRLIKYGALVKILADLSYIPLVSQVESILENEGLK